MVLVGLVLSTVVPVELGPTVLTPDDRTSEIGQLLLDAPVEFGLWFVAVVLAFLLHRRVRSRMPRLAIFIALAALTLMVMLGQSAVSALATVLQDRFDVALPYGGKFAYANPVARFVMRFGGLWICLYICARLAVRFQERGAIKSTPLAILTGTGIVFVGATLLALLALGLVRSLWVAA